MHLINLKGAKGLVENQKSLNLDTKEIVRKEIIKWFDADNI